jgi:toxin ParE1/3/4
VKPVVFHRAARTELDEAMGFYESCARGLGKDLQVKVEEAVEKIRRNPESWPPHKRTGFRKFFLERFPFTVFYIELPKVIWIGALAHARRRPDYWRRRRVPASDF